MEGTAGHDPIQHETTTTSTETHTGKRRKSSRSAVVKETINVTARPKAEITLQSLLEAGAHFGHQTSRWSPAMAPFIYTSRNGIHIINLPKTIQAWDVARKAIENIVSRGGNVLFVGTKKQAYEAIAEEARRCGGFFVAKRWLGGMMTNFQTIRKSIDRKNKLTVSLTEEEALITPWPSGGRSP